MRYVWIKLSYLKEVQWGNRQNSKEIQPCFPFCRSSEVFYQEEENSNKTWDSCYFREHSSLYM